MRRPVPTVLASSFVLAAALLAPASVAAVKLPSFLVAYTGQGAPGTSGPTFELLFTPSISELGDLGFRGRLTGSGTNSGNNFGLWRTGGGPVLLHVRAGDGVPGLAGTTWGTNFSDPNLQSAPGETLNAFTVQLNGTTSGASIWSELPAGLRKVAVLGEAVPGIPGATSSFLSGPLFNGASETVFGARVTGGGSVAADDTALFFDDGSSLSLLVREGQTAPGVAPAEPFLSEFAGAAGVLLAEGGIVTFLQTVNIDGFQRDGIWSNHGGSLALRVLENGAAPGLGGNEHINALSTLRGNRHGQIAFLASIENEFNGTVGAGLWISDADGGLSLALRRNGADPGLVPFAVRYTLADNGVLYLIGTLAENPSGSHDGIFALTPTAGWRELVRVGDRVPDLPAGIEYASFDQIVANENGQIAFRALVSGPGVVSTNNRVLVAQGSDLSFRLVERTGEQIEVSPGVFRTISSLNLTHTGSGGDGAPRGISNDGGLPYLAGTGGSSAAILVANMGIPPNVQLIGLEAVQVVQDWAASLPMVEGKRTYVRAHLQSTPPIDLEPVLRARPVGGGAELPFSPVFASNPGAHVLTSTNVALDRGELADSAFFEVPFEWTLLGDVELEVELPDRHLDCVETAGPVANDCKVHASFEEVPYPEVRMVMVDYHDATGSYQLSKKDLVELVRRFISGFPISSVDWTQTWAHWPIEASPFPVTCDVKTWLYFRKIIDGCREWEGCRRIEYGALAGNREDGCAQIGGWAAAGAMPADPTAKGRHNHTHEFGHVFGLQHTVDPTKPPEPNGDLPGFCSEVAGAGSPAYPYIHEIAGKRRPTLGPLSLGEDAKVFGLDTMQQRVGSPEVYFDLMSYCAVVGLDLWPGKTTYEFLKGAVETRFPRPSNPLPRSAADPDVLLVGGSIAADGSTATLLPSLTTPAGSPFPTPDPGPYTLRVLRAGGGIEDLSFAPAVDAGHGGDPTDRPFFFEVASPSTVDGVEIRSGSTVLASRAKSANPPVVQVLSPNGGEDLDQPTVEVSWSASDADSDPLIFLVQFSADAGVTWTTLETNWDETSVEVDRAALAGTTLGRIRVQASDGLRTASDLSDGNFAVEDNAPEVVVFAPENGGLFYDGQVLLLEALAVDPEDGALSGAAIAWSSNLSGDLGTGSLLTVAVADLADGLHVLTATAQDSEGNAALSQVSIRIDQPALLFEDDYESNGLTLWTLIGP